MSESLDIVAALAAEERVLATKLAKLRELLALYRPSATRLVGSADVDQATADRQLAADLLKKYGVKTIVIRELATMWGAKDVNPTSRIAKALDIRYQFARNALKTPPSGRRASATTTARAKAQHEPDHLERTAADLIRGRTAPTPIRDILAHLQSHGIHVGGKNPRNSLSAKFSHSHRFVPHGRAGWTLNESASGMNDAVEDAEAPGDVPDQGPPGASSRAGIGHSGNLQNGAEPLER